MLTKQVQEKLNYYHPLLKIIFHDFLNLQESKDIENKHEHQCLLCKLPLQNENNEQVITYPLDRKYNIHKHCLYVKCNESHISNDIMNLQPTLSQKCCDCGSYLLSSEKTYTYPLELITLCEDCTTFYKLY